MAKTGSLARRIWTGRSCNLLKLVQSTLKLEVRGRELCTAIHTMHLMFIVCFSLLFWLHVFRSVKLQFNVQF